MIEIFRQLYLLLWKNYVLRKRRKLRVIVEILWPLFLFLILMWVRTRGLKTNEIQCNFVERPLPSGGILPFIRSYICELNNSCSDIPRKSFYDRNLLELTQLSFDGLQFFNKPSTQSSLAIIVNYANEIQNQRNSAAQITKNLTLTQSIDISRDDFVSDLAYLSLTQTTLDSILASNPNYNYLYSNYSRTYVEPISQFFQLSLPQLLINGLYGPDLDRLDANRASNMVYDASWIRAQMCDNNTNQLLRGGDGGQMQIDICSLTNSHLASLFVYISESIDFTKVKKTVYDATPINNVEFFEQALLALEAFLNIKNDFQNSQILSKHNLTSLQDLFTKLTSFEPSQICAGSKLSLFDIIGSISIQQLDANTVQTLTDLLNTAYTKASSSATVSRLTSIISSNFEFSSAAWRNRENYGRVRKIQLDKKNNPFVEKSGSVLPTNARFGQQRLLDNSDDIEFTITILNSFNNLNKFNSTGCPALQFMSQLDIYTQALVNSSSSKTCFCKTAFALINTLSQDTQVLFNQIKPMLLGKILYAPNTAAYEQLIKRMNATFESIDRLIGLIGQSGDSLDNLIKRFNLTSPFAQDQLQQTLLSFGIDLTARNLTVNKLVLQLRLGAQLMKFIHNSLQCLDLDKFVGYDTEDRAVQEGLNLIEKQTFWSAIVFNNKEPQGGGLPKVLSYKIRMNATLTHNTIYTQDRIYGFGPSNCLGCNAYYLYGFIYIQDLLEKAIIEEKTNLSQNFGVLTQMTPYPCYVNDKFVNAISKTLPLFMVLAWIYTVSMMVKDIVYEKEKRLKEFMRVMGLSNGIHWLSWFITQFMIMFAITFILCIVIKFGKVTSFSDFFILLIFFACFTLATICQCFLISVFFNKANLAAVTAGIIYFLLYLPYTILINYAEVIKPWQKVLASLSSTVAFSYGCEIIASYELQTKGVQWTNFYSSPFAGSDTFSMNTICLLLLLDSAIYMTLTWYLEGIAPGEYGIPRKWYFPVQPSYWLGDSKKCIPKKNGDSQVQGKGRFARCLNLCWFDSKEKIIREEEAREEELKHKDQGKYQFLNESLEKVEDNQEESTSGIRINKLHKVYSRGNNHALKGLSVNFYENEISAFLGHNGAGKSTTMHLLTGLYKPTSGTAKINNLDITHSMDVIRKSLGFVPQHNVLFPGMTVKEHLWFYARLKGLATDLTKTEIEKMLEDTGLVDKKNELSKNLSGGMQRKLSVAIAFVGGSKTVILDEPSAGVDPAGRRSIWDLLFKYRKGRTIVISTHHMDEADVLGDRIAIISNGKLIAHGTSYFLKNKFGRGYYLTIAKRQLANGEEPTDSYVESSSTSASLSSGSSSRDSGARSMSSLSDGASPSVDKENNSNTSKNLPPPISALRFSKENSLNDDDDAEEIDMEDFEKAQLKNEQTLIASLASIQDIRINNFIKSKIPSALLVENIGTEMTYSISNKLEHTKHYESIFSSLEKSMPRLAIDSIGLSDTTLEEIFIKLAKQPKANSFQGSSWTICGFDLAAKLKNICSCYKPKEKPKKLTPEQAQKYSEYTSLRVGNNFTLIGQQLYALMLKRFHRVKRNIKGFFAEIVLPVVFVCLALLVATLTPKIDNMPALELHPWYYGQPNQMFFSRSSSLIYDRPIYDPVNGPSEIIDSTQQSNIADIERIYSTFLSSTGPGTRCMKGHYIVVPQQSQDYTRANGNVTLWCEQFDSANLVHGKVEPSLSVYQEFQSTNYSYTKYSKDCDCSSGFPVCPESAGGDYNYRNVYNLKTTDIFYDLTSRNMTDWLIKTEFKDQFFKKRFGGFEFVPTLLNVNNNFAAEFFQSLNDFSNTFNSLLNRLDSIGILSSNETWSLENTTNEIKNDFFSPNTDPLISNENVKIWYNTKGYDSSVSYLNVINNAILRAKIATHNELLSQTTNNSSPSSIKQSTLLDPAEHGIVAFNHPMPYTTRQYMSQTDTTILLNLFVAICIIFALSFIPASFLVFLLEERENNSKQLQFVSGVKPYIYWVSNFAWDLVNYIVPCVLCILIFIIFDVKAYMSPENFPCLVSLMLLYGWACIPLMYPLNYVFKVPSTAFVVSSSFNVFCGVVSTMTTTVLEQLGDDEPDLLQVNKVLKPLFVCLFPHYCLGQGFLEMARLYTIAEVKRSFGYTATYNPFVFDSVGRNLLAMAIQGFVYFALNLLIQYEFFVRFKPTADVSKLRLESEGDMEDDDVVNERNRVLANEANSKIHNGKNRFNVFKRAKSNSVTQNITGDNGLAVQRQDSFDDNKRFEETATSTDYIRRHVAVNNLCLGINKGECFGLIGVNGAGKTTTFKMLTGEIPITGGDVYVNGASVSKQIEKVHHNIGYCPQTDAIMPLLTAREHLIFFARLRGVPEKYVRQVSEWAMHRVGLTVFADRISGDFSGGNKRKLSTAIALVGNPSVICLDEPTSGMDAKARRLLWNDIISLVKENRIVILTSHSMEECEALCTRLVIMVNGKFKCLGSPQHLKTKFGSGYKLAVRLRDENDKQRLFAFMKKQFPTSLIQESHKNLFEYILPFNDTKLSEMFGKLEAARDELDIKDYSVSQTTLDQVFINFAKLQNEDPYSEDNAIENADQIEADIYRMASINKKEASSANYPREPAVEKNEHQKMMDEMMIGVRKKKTPKKGAVTSAQNSDDKNQYYFDTNNNLALRNPVYGMGDAPIAPKSESFDKDNDDSADLNLNNILPKGDNGDSAAANNGIEMMQNRRRSSVTVVGGGSAGTTSVQKQIHPSVYEISYL